MGIITGTIRQLLGRCPLCGGPLVLTEYAPDGQQIMKCKWCGNRYYCIEFQSLREARKMCDNKCDNSCDNKILSRDNKKLSHLLSHLLSHSKKADNKRDTKKCDNVTIKNGTKGK